MKILAIIPARRDSKRIPRKNVKLFQDQPLIEWTLKIAVACPWITKSLVTSNDPEVLELAGKYPRVDFLKRPEELSGDEVSGIEPVLHAMAQVSDAFDAVVLLQPTSPLRTLADLDGAFKLFSKERRPVVSVRRPQDPLHHAVIQDTEGTRLLSTTLDPKNIAVLNGAIYISAWDRFLREKTFLTSDTRLFEMDPRSSVDIDTPEDWERATDYAKHEQ